MKNLFIKNQILLVGKCSLYYMHFVSNIFTGPTLFETSHYLTTGVVCKC